MADTDFILKPLGDKIVVRPDKRTLSSVLIVQNNEYDNQGTVVAVGNGTNDHTMTVKVGDTVLFGKYSGQAVKVDGKEVLVMREDDIMAIVQK